MVQVQRIVVWTQMQDVCRWLITLRFVLSTGKEQGRCFGTWQERRDERSTCLEI